MHEHVFRKMDFFIQKWKKWKNKDGEKKELYTNQVYGKFVN